MKFQFNVPNVVVALVAAALILLPLYSQLSGNIFILTLFTRIVIFALAAASLNLIMGYGGMMSFGHAAYLGIGGYAVGMLAFEGTGSGFIQWPVALAASALYALVIGALSLRTRGVYFIMITLAFAQMAYYIASGMSRYGGDDGLTIYKRSHFGGLIDLSNRVQFYYLCLGCLFGGIYLIWRIINSRFGMVALLKELRKEVTIVLVEHDMEAVFALADRITVLVYGRVIASGVPDAIRSNEEVKRAYLGDQHVVAGHG